MENNLELDKFPSSYPYINRYGEIFTDSKDGEGQKINYLYDVCRRAAWQVKQNPDNWNLEIAEILLKTMNRFDPDKLVPIEAYLKIQMQYKIASTLRDMKSYVRVGDDLIRVSEISLNEDLVEVDQSLLTDQKSILYSVLRAVENKLGPREASYLRMKYMGYRDVEIAEQMDVSVRTMSRIRSNATEYLRQIL